MAERRARQNFQGSGPQQPRRQERRRMPAIRAFKEDMACLPCQAGWYREAIRFVPAVGTERFLLFIAYSLIFSLYYLYLEGESFQRASDKPFGRSEGTGLNL